MRDKDKDPKALLTESTFNLLLHWSEEPGATLDFVSPAEVTVLTRRMGTQ